MLGVLRSTVILMPSTSTVVLGIFLSAFISIGLYKVTSWRSLKLFDNRRKKTLDFSKIQPLSSFDLAKTPPYPYRPWKAGKYHMTMGLRKMPEEDWLVLDSLYEKEQELRRHLLENNRNGVMQCLPGSEEACEETLECVVKFLTKRFPNQFQHPKGDLNYVHNGITKRTFRITAPFEQHPLEISAQLTMEDINLLIQGKGETEYYLQAFSNLLNILLDLTPYRRASFSMGPAVGVVQLKTSSNLGDLGGSGRLFKQALWGHSGLSSH